MTFTIFNHDTYVRTTVVSFHYTQSNTDYYSIHAYYFSYLFIIIAVALHTYVILCGMKYLHLSLDNMDKLITKLMACAWTKCNA